MPPLIFAVREGSFDSVKALVDAKADVNQTSGDGSSPLLVAVLNGRYDIARYLIEKGAIILFGQSKTLDAFVPCVKHRSNETGTVPALPNADQAWDFIRLILDLGAEVNTRLAYETEVYVASHVFGSKRKTRRRSFEQPTAGTPS